MATGMLARPWTMPGTAVAATIGMVTAAAVGMAWLAPPVALVLGLGTMAGLVLAGYRWPRATLLVVALVPLGDPFLVRIMLPTELLPAVRFLSEGLLVVVGLGVGTRALRAGAVLPALRHPATVWLVLLVVVAAASAVLNGTRPLVALAGVVFTVDALLVFYLARAAGADNASVRTAIRVILSVMGAASVLAVVQALLAPDILWFRAFPGSFGEGGRVTAFFGNPNMLGAMLAATIPLAVLQVRGAVSWRRVGWVALSFLLVLTLLLTYSRGAWLGAVLGFGLLLLLLDRRTLLVTLAILAAALLTAMVMPRNLLLAPDQRPDYADGTGPDAPGFFESTIDRIDALSDGRDLRTRFVLEGLPIIRDHPLLGVGPGMYGGAAASIFDSPVYEEYDTSLYGFNTVHNYWLHLLGELGVLGTLAFIGLLFSVGWPILRSAWSARGFRRAALVGILGGTAAMAVNSVTEMLLEGNSAAFLFWYLLGIGSVLAARPAAGGSELAPGDELPGGAQQDPDVEPE